MTNLLLDEMPLLILPKLATLIGLNEAILLQQIHYWIEHARRSRSQQHYHDGKWWVWNSYEQWQSDNFPFWSTRTIRRTVKSLAEKGLLHTGHFNRKGYDRTTWYSINYERLDEIAAQGERDQAEEGTANPNNKDQAEAPCGQNVHMHADKMAAWTRTECPDDNGQHVHMHADKMAAPIPETNNESNTETRPETTAPTREPETVAAFSEMPTELPNVQRLWADVLGEMRLKTTGSTFDRWFARTRLLRFIVDGDEATATIEVPDQYAREWIGERWRNRLERTIADIAHIKTVHSEFTVASEMSTEEWIASQLSPEEAASAPPSHVKRRTRRARSNGKAAPAKPEDQSPEPWEETELQWTL